MEFERPYSRDGWNVFENAILTNLDVADCNDAVGGRCISTNTQEECLKICQKTEGCKNGYYIETGTENICVPLMYRGEDTLSYRLRNKNYYPVLKNMRTAVFSSLPYPPNRPNDVFFADNFVLNIGGKPVGLSPKSGIDFSTPTHIQFLPPEITRSNIQNYVAVKNGTPLILSIPKTAYLLGYKDNKFVWGLQSPDKTTTFVIHTDLDGNMTYDQKFYLTYQGQVVTFENDSLVLKPEKTENSIFTVTPKVEAFYCDNGTCKMVSLENTERKGETATYQGKAVGRSPVCWNLCGKGNSKLFIPILIAIFALVVLLFYLKSRR